MNRLRVLLALVALLALSWPAGAVQSPTIGPKVYDGLLDMAKAAGYKTPFAPAVTSAETIAGDAVSLGSKIKYFGAWGLLAGGAVLTNAALNWAMHSIDHQAFGADAAACLDYSANHNLSVSTVNDIQCTEYTQTSPLRLAPGDFPEPGKTVYWYNGPVEQGSHFFRITGQFDKYGDGIKRYTVSFVTCRAGESGTTDLEQGAVTNRWNYFKSDMERPACTPPQTTTHPVPYLEYMKGSQNADGSEQVGPHPNLETQMRQILPTYLSTVAPYSMPTTMDQPWPGIQLEPVPNVNQIADQPIDPNIDTDGDGTPDKSELEPPPGVMPTDPNDKKSKPPTPDEKAKADCEATGGTYSGGTCTPAKDPKKECEASGGTYSNGTCTPAMVCPEGQVKGDDGKCTEKPKDCPEGEVKQSDGTCKKKEDPDPGNACGDFAIARLLKYTKDYLHDVVFPCDDLKWDDLTDLFKDKFPFSIASQASTFVSASGSSSDANPLPTDIGPFHLDFSWASGFFAFIKVAFRAALWFFFFRFLLDRVSGQVVLS